ncbi:hypothetical protein AYK24_03335 [Thermoplasmatales archaeon SG8-52-4]|nr:MAG: hypothetical protein AYK24_03335 [Thermoplasmatales archaeon SG8-52-4]
MIEIDKIVFGDNQFFGINHMSQEKAQQLAEKFHQIENIFKVYDIAIKAGINAIMLNSNEKAKVICEHFKTNEKKYGYLNWYPSIPYPHKYSNLVAEKGIFPAINEVLFKNNNAKGVADFLVKGGTALLTKDAIKMMQMLIDTEMKMFKGLNIKVVFLQNIVTDLLLGFNIKLVFEEYCNYIRKKYKALPGLITQNLPWLLNKLSEWDIHEVVVCSSFNKIGYLMSPDVQSYIEVTSKNNSGDYQIMAMSTLASGAIVPKEAYAFINEQNIQSVVFGASSEKHIKETINLINPREKLNLSSLN